VSICGFISVFVTMLAVALVPQIVAAADAKAGVLQNPAPLDDDFFLQGEYSGAIASTGFATGQVGVQVIALGKGKFEAVEFSGGLPGNGGDIKTRRKYTGQKSTAGTVELSGGPHRLTLRRGSIAVKDDSGKSLGVLRKTQRASQTLRAAPPPGAKVLFFGRDARQFTKGSVTPDHLLVAGANTKEPFGDFTMHLEFRTPYMSEARGQGRGNSGVYVQGRYEVQILDSFGLEGANNECGGLYKQRAPLLNMCFPPLTWQTYDIDFTAARFDAAGKKTRNARITVRHNGVVVHNDVELTAKTGGGAAEGLDPRPIKLQDHGNPVHFRNIWIAERNGAVDACNWSVP
jgi:hypothetical protein